MVETLTTALRIASWDETPIREFADGSKLSRAEVSLSEGRDGVTEGASAMVLYYRPDGTSTYSTVMQISGTLAGRTGSFVLQGEGAFDGTTASGTSSIVPGSGTGDLDDISGTCRSTSTHSDYPFMPLILTYHLG